jgi:NADH:ubiquinone oxidoreductase subunit 5 (subunit L)/multisubunit Na+/H+ antiporter MnhA subunit
MEGPTPVSSLLHAATMVTAGIFLTVRCSFIFNNSSTVPIYIILVGAITSFFSSLVGFTQHDLKKIVAYSTCSQLGFMFLSNGIFSYNHTMFHLFNHAFFKALLFLTSGYLIHIMSDEQDLRKMGGLIKIIPLPYICLLIGSIALMGVPYLSGFFSKDSIVESFYTILISNNINLKYYSIVFFSQLLLSVSCIFTILYSIKLIYFAFVNSYNGFYKYISNIHFSSFFIILPLILLSFLSIFSGYLFNDFMIGIGTYF